MGRERTRNKSYEFFKVNILLYTKMKTYVATVVKILAAFSLPRLACIAITIRGMTVSPASTISALVVYVAFSGYMIQRTKYQQKQKEDALILGLQRATS